MNDTMMQEILKRLDVLGERVGTGAAFTWATLLRQAFLVDGVMLVVLAIVLAIIAYGMYRAALYYYKKEQEDRYGAWFMGMILASLAVFGFGVATIVNAVSGIQHILNPQYYALMDLTRMLGK